GLMQKIIINSNKTNNDDPLPHEPFQFCAADKLADTEFEMELVCNGVRYQYGFAFNAHRITEEWLFAYPKGKPQKWLMRYFDETQQTTVFERCDNLKGAKKVWESVTRDNALFLATAVQLKSTQLTPVFNWFSNTLRVIDASGPCNSVSIKKMLNGDAQVKNQMVRFMKAADFGIHDFKVDVLDYEQKLNEMPQSLSTLIKSAYNSPQFVEILSAHINDENELEYLSFKDESDGTQRVFDLAGPWLDALQQGYVLVMDEMNLHLHPNLATF
ncbi:MAG: ATP-binding protein, partial [Psychrosphaera sp.]|nr:ATP-binding protein [Psychrosphaera sp.]